MLPAGDRLSTDKIRSSRVQATAWRLPRAFCYTRPSLRHSIVYLSGEESTRSIYVVNDAHAPVDHLLTARVVDRDGMMHTSAETFRAICRPLFVSLALDVQVPRGHPSARRQP